MQQILSIWAGLELRKKIVVVLATVAVFAAVLSLTRVATKPGMALLYSGLESGAAGDVVRALEQHGAKYEVRGGAIYVDTSTRDELRMTLASEGLPANSTQGYELLDTLSGFGTTSQMFDAAYWRAKEGELARTIVGSPMINQARVHIANASSNPFQRNSKSSASVTITSTSGAIPAKQAQALRFLVASAVAGLAPEDVAIIDGNGGLVGAADEPATKGGEDRAEQMRASVQRLLEARVGAGNAVVEVSLDTVTESELITQRIFDPDSRVAISVDTEERSTDSQNSGSGQVTVASNLPDGDAIDGAGSMNQNRESRERINYEVSETQREVVREPGAIRRLSVAVLINGTPSVSQEGDPVLIPRPDAELAAMRELVASAVGFDEARGDVITLKSMNFLPIVPLGTVAEAGFFDQIEWDAMSLIQMAVLAIVALILGLFVIRPLLMRSKDLNTLPETTQLSGPEAAGNDIDPTASLIGEIDPDALPMPESETTPDLPLPAHLMTQSDAVERLRSMINDRQQETVEILRSWLDDGEEKA